MEAVNGSAKVQRKAKSKELPCYIVEDHHEVIPCLYRLMGAKRIPLNSNTIIHLDSHPDMGIPKNMKADTVYNKRELFDALSIESWMMPACYAGHFNKILWVKPPWALQMPEGEYNFKIGKEMNTEEIRLSSTLEYFVGEFMFCRQENLENPRDVSLIVRTLGQSALKLENSENYDIYGDISNEDSTYVLDVDLDFFSTRNPFRALYKNAELYESLKHLYYFVLPDTKDLDALEVAVASRKEQIDDLCRLWKHVEISGINTDPTPNSERWPAVKKIAENVLKFYNEVDWQIVHDAGCTWDDTDLPEHVSSPDELERLLGVFREMVSRLVKKPGAITISRSSEDDYCPPEDVEWIQNQVISALKSKWEDVSVHEVYLEE